MADDMGYEAVGSYGGQSYRTPVLDELSRTGVRFNHAYAQPLCTPTRVQLMTGKYNHRNWVAFGILDPAEKTIGHYMQEAGYKTCMVGKWQLTSYDPPDYPGAEQRRGIGMHPQAAGFDEYSLWHTGHTEDKGSRYADPVVLENGKLRQDLEGKYGPDIFVDYLNDFLERHHGSPFFVYYSMALPHGPFVPTPGSPEWQDPSRRHENDPRYYRDMVEYLDRMVGRVVAKVDQLGIRDNTLILFFSDNGTPREVTSRLGEEDVQGGKGYTTDAGTRVPLIASWPGRAAGGRVLDDLVDSTDFLPTLLEAAGRPIPGEMDGRSFLAQLEGRSGQPRDWVFFHYDPRPGWDKDKYTLQRFARDQRYKLYEDGRLYDIPNDVGEKHPIAPAQDSAESAAARQKLKQALDRMQASR